MTLKLQELAERIGATVAGDSNVGVSAIASIESAGGGALVYATDERRLADALASRASAILTKGPAPADAAKPLLLAADPRLAFARAAAVLGANEQSGPAIDPRAFVDAGAKFGKGSRVGAGAYIAAGAVIGADCRIGPNVTIHGCVQIGDRVVVQAGSVIGSDGFGYVRDEGGRYLKFPQVGRVEIGDDVEIGACCTIDRGALDATVIARGAKLDNLIHVGHNVRIGADVVIAAQTGISGSVTIGAGAVIGGQVGIGDHVTIEGGVVIGSGGGVLSNKVVRNEGVVLWGVPARPLPQYLRELATVARLARKQRPQGGGEEGRKEEGKRKKAKGKRKR